MGDYVGLLANGTDRRRVAAGRRKRMADGRSCCSGRTRIKNERNGLMRAKCFAKRSCCDRAWPRLWRGSANDDDVFGRALQTTGRILSSVVHAAHLDTRLWTSISKWQYNSASEKKRKTLRSELWCILTLSVDSFRLWIICKLFYSSDLSVFWSLVHGLCSSL